MYQALFDRVEGELTADISAIATLIPVDAETYSIVENSLAPGNWSYLLLRSATYTEEIKVTGVSAGYLTAIRGTSLSTPREFYLGDALESSFQKAAVTDVISQSSLPSDLIIGGGGLAFVEQTGNNVTIRVETPTFVGTDGVVVVGSWPDYEISVEEDAGGCCGGGSSGGSAGGGISELSITGGFLQGNITGSVLELYLPAPTFTGAGITVTGTWPNINFAIAGGGGGSGTVTQVGVGAGLVVTGNPAINPTISIQNSGVVSGDYGGLVVLATGQIANIPAGFNPVSAVTIDSATVTRTGGTVNIDLNDADVGQKGVIAVAEYNGTIDGANETEAVTPKYLKDALQMGGDAANGTNTGEADNLYNNLLNSTAVTVNLASGEKALLIGNVTVMDATTTPVVYGIAIFNGGGAKITSSRSMAQSNQTILGILNGPYTGAATLVTTALPSGANVQGSVLTLQKL